MLSPYGFPCGTYLLTCHRLILTYLIPTHLLTTHSLPSPRLLRYYPHLSSLFNPLTRAIRLGSLSAYDEALAAGEPEFVKRRIYLTLERARDLCLRNLLRKVCKEQRWEEDGKIRKVGLEEFVAAVRLSERGAKVERDEVECLLANMIYKVRLIPDYAFYHQWRVHARHRI